MSMLSSRVVPCSEDSPGLSGAGFAEAFSNYPMGAALVSADSIDGPIALITSRVMPISTEPPIFAVVVERGSDDDDLIAASESIVLQLLTADQLDLAILPSTDQGKAREWARLSTGEAFVIGPSAWVRGQVIERIEIGDSTIVTARATHACYPPVGMTRDAAWPGPLVRHRNHWHELNGASHVTASVQA